MEGRGQRWDKKSIDYAAPEREYMSLTKGKELKALRHSLARLRELRWQSDLACATTNIHAFPSEHRLTGPLVLISERINNYQSKIKQFTKKKIISD